MRVAGASRQGPRSGPTPAHLVFGCPDLLHCIAGHLSQRERLGCMPLVCKSFAAALAAPGACWREVEVDGLGGAVLATDAAAAAFFAGLAAWLARRAPGLRALRLRNLRQMLQCLAAPQQLAVLAAVWAALAPPRSLRTLDIGRSCHVLPAGGLAALAPLVALRTLRLHSSGPLGFAELDRLADVLPELQELSVRLVHAGGAPACFHGPFPARLCAAPRLRHLRLHSACAPPGGAACELPPDLGLWPLQLEELHLTGLGLRRLPPTLGELRALRALCLRSNGLGADPHALPDELSWLTALTRLDLGYNGFEGGPPPLAGRLPALRELHLGGNPWGGTTADLPPEYRGLTRLRVLSLTNCRLESLPPAVAQLPGLQELKLNINSLQTLPGGPYLRRLEALDLSINSWAGYPPALAAATRLQRLAFQFNGVHYTDPARALREAAPPRGAAPAPAGGATAAEALAAAALLGAPPPAMLAAP